jgi:hypothetical protein
MIGDNLNLGLKVIPTFALASSVYCDVSCEIIARFRDMSVGLGDSLSPDVWHISNNLSDVLVQPLHLVFWGTLLVLIEKGFFRWLRMRPNKKISDEAKQLDDDV